jgi:hypothetical protein
MILSRKLRRCKDNLHCASLLQKQIEVENRKIHYPLFLNLRKSSHAIDVVRDGPLQVDIGVVIQFKFIAAAVE